VDFESGLNTAVKKLRIALGDSGECPRYIETLPRRGYRLIVPVILLSLGPPSASAPLARNSAGQWPRDRIGRIALLAMSIAAAAAALVALGRRDPAEQVLLRPVGQGRDSKNPEANAYFAKAELFMGAGLHDLGRSRQMLERALQLDRRFGRARVEYGFTHLIMVNAGYSNDPSWLYSAEEEIQQGLRDDPTFSHGHTALAAVSLHHGRKEQAPGEAETALKMNPADIDARHWLAVYRWYSGDSLTARKLEMENVARNGRFFPARMTLGELARQEGDWAGSLREHEKVLEYDAHNVFVLVRTARTYMDAGDLVPARRILYRACSGQRQNFAVRAAEALLLAHEGKRADAAKAMDTEVLKYLELNPLDTLIAAEFHAIMGNTRQALEWLDRAVRNGDERSRWFARDPALVSIRRDPHFQQILDSVASRRTDFVERH
jgi:tetratricopeptide (TPR) repeat protein